MATFDDILNDAQPALLYGRNAVEQEATEGRDWFWTFALQDRTGALINLETLGVTAECVVYPPEGRGQGTSVALIAPTVTIAGTTITVEAEAADTDGLAGDATLRRCPWRFTLIETATGRTVDAWGVRDSTLAIRGEN